MRVGNHERVSCFCVNAGQAVEALAGLTLHLIKRALVP